MSDTAVAVRPNKPVSQITMRRFSEIRVDPGFNPRNMNSEATKMHIEGLKDSIRARGFDIDQPLMGYVDDDKVFTLINGHCRVMALSELAAEGNGVEFVPTYTVAKDFTADERTLATLRDPGRPLTPFEAAVAIQRLLDAGWERSAISAKLGKTVMWVHDQLLLASAPERLKEAVIAEQIASTEAVRLMKRFTTDEGLDEAAMLAVLDEGIEKAKTRGASRAMPRDLGQSQTAGKPAPAVSDAPAPAPATAEAGNVPATAEASNVPATAEAGNVPAGTETSTASAATSTDIKPPVKLSEVVHALRDIIFLYDSIHTNPEASDMDEMKAEFHAAIERSRAYT